MTPPPSATPDVPASGAPAEGAGVGVLALVAVFLVARVIVPLGRSLWIDELLTAWSTDGSVSTTIDRVAALQPHSPLYYLIVEAFSAVLGRSETALRVPSVLFFLASLVVFWRLVARLCDRRIANLSTVGLAVIPSVSFTAADARPYALALLALIVATDVLERWLRLGGLRWAAVYGAAAALVWYVHYVFVAGLVAHFAFILYTAVSDAAARRRLRGEVAVAMGIGGLIVVGTLPQILALFGRTEELAFSDVPSLARVVEVLVVPVLAFPVLALLVAAPFMRGPRVGLLDRRATVLGIVGAITPILLLFAMARVTDVVLWDDRYHLMMMPFAALLFGGLVAGLASPRLATWIMIVLLAGSTVVAGSRTDENWRSAIDAANQQAQAGDVMLLGAGLVESGALSFFDDPLRRAYLSAPTAYYPTPRTVIPIPRIRGLDAVPEVFEAALSTARGAPNVVYVARRSMGERVLLVIESELEQAGYTARWSGAHGGVIVRIYEAER